MSRLLALITVAFSALTSLSAQDRKASLRFLADGLPAELGKVVWVAAGKTGGELALEERKLSDPVTVPARVIGLQSAHDQRKLGVITLPASGDSFVVLLTPAADGGLSPFVIDAKSSAFRAGDVFIFNRTDKTITGRLGTREFELAPGQGKPLRPAGNLAQGSYEVVFNVREQAGERPLRSMRWPVLTRSRSYCVFSHNPAKNRIDFNALEESVQAAANR